MVYVDNSCIPVADPGRYLRGFDSIKLSTLCIRKNSPEENSVDSDQTPQNAILNTFIGSRIDLLKKSKE